MKFTVLIDENCEKALHELTSGEAFALDTKRKFALFGGQYFSTLVDVDDPSNIIKQFPLKTPLKWFVSNYEWDPLSTNGNERFLQTRNKLIELVNCETSDTVTLDYHGRTINDAKWSPFKRNLLASTSADSNILLWNTDTPKPALVIPSYGEPGCLSWNKLKDDVFAVSCNNDIRIYDIRKTNSALRYISNAHAKKIYSLDWCASEEILLSSSRDRNIKLWNFNMRNQKFMEKILEDFPCWKAKFTPYGLCFTVIPTCLSPPKVHQFINQSINSEDNYNLPFTNISNVMNPKTSISKINSPGRISNTSFAKAENEFSDLLNNSENIRSDNNTGGDYDTNKTRNLSSKNDPITSLLICQIISFDEAKILKFTTKCPDMILNYDFYPQNDKFNIISWTQNQHLSKQSIDLTQIAPKDLDKSLVNQTKFEEDIGALKSINNTSNSQSSVLQIQPNTTNSSRKSSISEYGYGTPPTNLTSILSNRLMAERESINLNEIVGHEFLKKNPKCFGAKFGGLPNQMIIFSNEGISHNSTKINHREHENSQFTKRVRSHTKNKGNQKSMYHKHVSKRTHSKVYIYDITCLLNISIEFAQQYHISNLDLKSLCERNIAIAVNLKRFDIVRIWEVVKFVTFNNIEKFSLNPDHGRPWSCSTFGRPLVQNVIDNCIKSNDIQSAAMIISKLKQHDMSMIPNASTVDRRSKLGTKNNFRETTSFTVSTRNSTRIVDDPTLDASSHLVSQPDKLGEYNDDSDLTKHHRNLGLLDPMRLNEFDTFIKFYCEILYQWSLFNKRIEMLEFIYEKPNEYDDKFECSKKCAKCSSPTINSVCPKCNAHILNCSICHTPVNGLSTYCVLCGHGGHYNHLIEWFKRHDDCPSACGCRCVDYL